MPVFDRYASYYDHLYGDKDYPAECDYLEMIFSSFASAHVKKVLEFGCGTAQHALILGQRGYKVHGIDRSGEMLSRAREKIGTTSIHGVTLHQGDIRTLELGRIFDAVIAMFAVIGYVTENDDLVAVFKNARKHLVPGGLFTFDAWYGPAVLVQRPADRYKLIDLPGERLIRFARPALDLERDVVTVRYKVIWIRDGQVHDEVDETHSMRYFFIPELVYFLENSGFDVLHFCPFLDLGNELSDEEWNFSVVARAR